MDRYPSSSPDGLEPADDVELLEDRTRPISGRRAGRRLGVSVPGAIAGAFLVTALALGATFRPTAIPAGGAGSGEDAAPVGEPGDGPLAALDVADDAPTTDDGDVATGPGTDAEQPAGTGDGTAEEPGADAPDGDAGDGAEGGVDGEVPATEPTDEPEPTPAPAPEVRAIEIGLGLNDGKVVVEWSRCDPDGFVAWKVIRSTDSTVTYPRGANDTLVAAIEDRSRTRFVDLHAPSGHKVWYRVFAVAQQDGHTRVACQSPGRAITVPSPEPEPQPEPTAAPLGLALSIRDGHPYVDWTVCQADGFDFYKVVRSSDSTVRWPLGDNDTQVAAVGPDGTTAVLDGEAAAGHTFWYRVFCVESSEAGYRILASSAARAIATPAAESTPTPETVVLGFELDVVEGSVILHWQQCAGESFHYYKVVRSRNANPSYLPFTDGTQVVAVIENGEVVEFVDPGVDGGTWYYRVQSIGYAGEAKVLLGQTPVKSVTIE